MAVYLIGQIKVRNDQLWQKYVDGVRESLVPVDAKIVFRGKQSSVLSGKNDHELVVVIEFADQQVLESWFNSERYQSVVSLRDQAADVVITTYDTY